MESISITLNDCTNTDDNYHFPHPIQLSPDKNYKAGLVYFSGWNNIHNITDANNIFRYSSDGGVKFKEIKLINGAYNISDIDNELKKKF